jgi:hypothetical protein
VWRLRTGDVLDGYGDCVGGFRKSSGQKGWLLDHLGGLRHELSFLIALRALPPRVALFQWRARRLALRIGDRFSLVSATRPQDLAELMSLARGRRHVVELGTGTAWTTSRWRWRIGSVQ